MVEKRRGITEAITKRFALLANAIKKQVHYKTSARINYFKITESDLLSMIKSLDSTKGDGYDNLSVRMIKV